MGDLYTYSMVIILTLLLFMGGYLIFGRVPVQLKRSIYRSSRRVAGSVYIICAVHIAASLLFDLRLLESNMAPATCITTYYLMGLLWSWSFTRLVGDKYYFSKRRVIFYFGVWALYTVVLLGLVHFVDKKVGQIVVVVAALLYVVIVALIVKLFSKAYRIALIKAENYFSESVEVIIHWISKSAKYLMVLGFFGGLMAFCPPICVVAIAIYAVGVMIYIFSNFIIMMIDIPQ